MKIIFYSFYTKDEFYTDHSKQLSENLDQLGYEYHFEPIEIPEGLEWPDLCRKKIGLLYHFYLSKPDYKVVWIDIDCRLGSLPEFFQEFSSDIIGFQRGFGEPKRLGYNFKSRFWEPCLLGFNRTAEAETFLRRAYELEQEYEGRATDDYFFEESWRECSPMMSYQLIPSCMAKIEGRTLGEGLRDKFFEFGSSGNVKEFAKKVDQHTVDWIPKVPLLPKKTYNLSDKLKWKLVQILPEELIYTGKKILSNKYKKLSFIQFKRDILKHAKAGNGAGVYAVVDSQLGARYLTAAQKKVLNMANTFLYYLKNKEAEEIELSWWANPEPGNFGDWLSPYIFHKISGRNIRFVNPESKTVSKKHYFSVGSIGKFIKANSVVLGVGCSTKETIFNPDADYRFVRGPLTRDMIISSGGECPEVYGDPGIIMPKLYTPKKISAYEDKYILVRHFTHLGLDLTLDESFKEVSIFQSHPRNIEKFIDRVTSAKGVVTSAMHCYIICQAYGIPCLLVTFEGLEGAVHGDGTKYRDYHLGVGLEPVDPKVIGTTIDSSCVKDIKEISISSDKIEEIYEAMVRELLP